MGIAFFVFFFQSRTRSAFSHQTDNNTATTSAIPILNVRDALGRTPHESARAYASMPPDEAETEGVWVRRCDAVVGGVSLRSGQRTERDKKNEKKNVFALYGHLPVIQTQQPTKTHARNAGDKCEEVRPVRSAGGARFDRWGQSSWAGGIILK